MHVALSGLRVDRAGPPRWTSLVLALVVLACAGANAWAAPRAVRCEAAVGGDRDADGDVGYDDDACAEDACDADTDADADVDVDVPVPGPASAPARVVAPPVHRVIAAATRAAGLDGHPARAWTRRARLGGLVPWISVRTGRNTSWADATPGAIDHGTTVEARATWRLDRLVFDGHELQIASIEAARRRERRRLATHVVRAYFNFLRTADAARRQPRWTSRADEAAAELDALTDGWFSEELGRLRRTASETRTR